MRFNVTPAQVKKVATRMGIVCPAISHSNCLDISARMLGYSHWHEVVHTNADAAGATFPLEYLPGTNKEYLRFPAHLGILCKQAQEAMRAVLDSDQLIFTKPGVEPLVLSSWMDEIGAVGFGDPEVQTPHRRLEFESLPKSGAPLYLAGLSDGLQFTAKDPRFFAHISDATSGALAIDATLLPYAEPWSEEVLNWVAENKTQFSAADLHEFVSEPKALAEESEGLAIGNRLITNNRAAIFVRDSPRGRLLAVLVVEVTFICPLEGATTVALIALKAALALPSPADTREAPLAELLGAAAWELIRRPVSLLCTATLGAPNQVIELNICVTEQARARSGGLNNFELEATVEEIRVSILSHPLLAGQWPGPDDTPGFHLYTFT